MEMSLYVVHLLHWKNQFRNVVRFNSLISFPSVALAIRTLESNLINIRGTGTTDRGVLPGVDVAVYIEHWSDVKVHVSHHLQHF